MKRNELSARGVTCQNLGGVPRGQTVAFWLVSFLLGFGHALFLVAGRGQKGTNAPEDDLNLESFLSLFN